MDRNIKWILIFVGLITVVLARQYTGLISVTEEGGDFGFWSIVPALVTLFLCFATRGSDPLVVRGNCTWRTH